MGELRINSERSRTIKVGCLSTVHHCGWTDTGVNLGFVIQKAIDHTADFAHGCPGPVEVTETETTVAVIERVLVGRG